MKSALAFATLLLVAACSGKVADPALDATAAEPPGIAPDIISPHEAADPTEPPSYEVAIASAAAVHNAATEHCTRQPQAVRAQCLQEANAAFAEARTGLDRLRGNQQ
jgi:hypothetical protein